MKKRKSNEVEANSNYILQTEVFNANIVARRNGNIPAILSILTNEVADNDVAEFFVGCNVPYNAVNSGLFKKMIKSVQNAHVTYVLPNRRKLANKLLSKLIKKYQKEKNDAIEQVSREGRSSTITSDEAKITRRPLSNVVAAIPGEFGCNQVLVHIDDASKR